MKNFSTKAKHKEEMEGANCCMALKILEGLKTLAGLPGRMRSSPRGFRVAKMAQFPANGGDGEDKRPPY